MSFDFSTNNTSVGASISIGKKREKFTRDLVAKNQEIEYRKKSLNSSFFSAVHVKEESDLFSTNSLFSKKEEKPKPTKFFIIDKPRSPLKYDLHDTPVTKFEKRWNYLD